MGRKHTVLHYCKQSGLTFSFTVRTKNNTLLVDLFFFGEFDGWYRKVGNGRVVCVFSSHSFWTSGSLDVPAGVTQEEGHTGFFIHLLSAVRALVYLARRIQFSLSFSSSTVKSNFVY